MGEFDGNRDPEWVSKVAAVTAWVLGIGSVIYMFCKCW